MLLVVATTNAAAAIAPTIATPRVKFGVACPRRWHVGGRRVGAVIDEHQVLVVANRLTELAEHVIIDVASVATRLKERSGVSETSQAVVTGKEIGTDGQENSVGIGIWLHVRLVGEPVINAKGNLQGLGAVFFVLGKGTGLRGSSENQSLTEITSSHIDLRCRQHSRYERLASRQGLPSPRNVKPYC